VLQEWLEQLPQEWEDFEEPALAVFTPAEMAQQETCFFTRALPHFSHVTEAAAENERRNFSKTRPHFWHL
jgi:hypothetical protein